MASIKNNILRTFVGQASRAVYLPNGSQWYYFTDDKRPLQDPVQGGMEFDFYAPWNDSTRDNCAIYIREGAIIPMREIEQYIGELHSHDKMNPITFSIYPGRNSSYKMFLDDDGVTNKAETAGQYRLIEISHEGEAMFIASNILRVRFPPRLPFIIDLDPRSPRIKTEWDPSAR